MALSLKRKKRVMRGCANPLFVKWIEELRDVAKEKGLQSQYTYAKALNSLKKYPLPLQSGEEAKILDYIGDKLAKILDKKLLEYRSQGETPAMGVSSRGCSSHLDKKRTTHLASPYLKESPPRMVIPTASSCKTGIRPLWASSTSSSSSSPKRPSPARTQATIPSSKLREYVPAYRSGSYALIIALYRGREKPSWKGYSVKADLIQDAQPFSSESFTVSSATTYYTAWSSMSTLIKKGLVEKRSRPAKFFLTKQGEEMALKLLQASQSICTEEVNDCVSLETSIESESSCSARTSAREELPVKTSLVCPDFQLDQGSFEVVLLVDSSESTASRTSTSHFNGILLQELGRNGVTYDVRKMNVGDFTWIARKKTGPEPGCLSVSKTYEAVLQYIIERKRIDDLAGSIVDGRFKEQKFRLKNSGILYPIYLIEEHGGVSHNSLDTVALEQAITNTQVHDRFFIKWTKEIHGTVAYLTFMTRLLQQVYANKSIQVYPRDVLLELTKEKKTNTELERTNTVQVMSFNSFNEGSLKNKDQYVQEVFMRQLMMIPGVSLERAAVLLNKYPTLSHLQAAYFGCSSEEEKIRLLEDLQSGSSNRRFGRSLSELVYSMYCK